MRCWNSLIIVLLFCSCNGRNINSLKHEIVKFENLPIEVADYLENPEDYHDDILYMLIELPKGVESRYKIEVKKAMVGPWESHKELINTKEDVLYEIDRDVPRPYIVFENKLYIPDRYNIFTTVEDLNSLEFLRYELN